MRRPLLLPLLCAGLAPLLQGCDALGVLDVAPPARAAGYDFRLEYDTLVFRWPAERLPVRIFVERSRDLPGLVAGGAALWESSLLYGELTTALTDDSTAADIVVKSRVAPPSQGAEGLGPGGFVITADSIGACGGSTVGVPDSELVLTGPITVSVWLQAGRDSAAVAACFRFVVAHEVGHAFGILAHSPWSGDLMARIPTRLELTAADRATFQRLYHTRPHIRPPAR